MEILNAYLMPVILVACLLVGWIVKKWVNDVDNKWIPTIVALLGVVLAIVTNWGAITLDLIVGGAVSGLASTGLHQMFTQWVDKSGTT